MRIEHIRIIRSLTPEVQNFPEAQLTLLEEFKILHKNEITGLYHFTVIGELYRRSLLNIYGAS